MYYYKDECFLQHGDISISKYSYNHPTTEHKHDFFELAYVVDGKGVHIIDGRRYDIAKGDYMLLDTTAAHCYEGNIVILNLIFNPAFLDKNYRHIKEARELYSALTFNTGYSIVAAEPIYHIFHDNGDIQDRIDYIRREIEEKSLGYADCVRSALLEIIMKTVRSICRENMSMDGDGKIAYVEKYIYDHYDEDVSLSELCEEMGYSLPYVSKQFKTVTGCTFSEYLQKTRVHYACSFFVNNPHFTIDEVAEKVGYSDIKHFSAVFKKYVGTTPGAFAKGLKNRQKDKIPPSIQKNTRLF